MGSITLTISYAKNKGIAMSSAELKALYLLNIPLVSTLGISITDDVIDQYLQQAQDQLENNLNVFFAPRAYEEDKDFFYDDFIQWGYFPVTYPVVYPYSVQGFFNTTMQINYPQTWLSSKMQTDDIWHRTINLVPLQGSASTLSGTSLFNISPYIGVFGNKSIPNYWKVVYITGFDKVPASLFKALSIMATIDVLTLASINVFGAGIASKSIGIDGLSQNVSTTANASKIAFGNLIDQYQKQLDPLMDTLKAQYNGSPLLGVL